MSKLSSAELVIYDILANDRALQREVRQLHTRLKNLDDYHDMLPGVGIKATEYNYDPESGEEYAEGFCEVVAAGEYEPASASSEGIGDRIFNLLTAHAVKGKTDTQDYQGVESGGYKSVSGQWEAMFVCITHVFWRVWF